MTEAYICDAVRTPIGRYGGATACHQLARRGGGDALCTMCIGVGQGIAMVIEHV